MTTTLFMLLAYSAGIIGLGLWIGRKVRTAEGFFVAGRSLGPGLVFSTMLAANIGAGSTVGNLLGTRMVLNEFVAYSQLGPLKEEQLAAIVRQLI